jgi:PTH1 family peptidyl-tRNA hydrolase
MQQATTARPDIKVIIGLGNPGLTYSKTRHNIGFRVLDELARRCHETWKQQGNMEVASIEINDGPILLVKPQTTMNVSGKVVPALQKQGIKPEQILVVHDELELPFGKLAIKQGGSHKGHNGLRSLIECMGPDFMRLRFGIGRPENKEDVPDYVLASFNQPANEVEDLISKSIEMIEGLFQ